MRKPLIRFLLGAVLASAMFSAAAADQPAPATPAKPAAAVLLDKAPEANGGMNDITKMEKEGPPIARNYAQQPPLIPHAIKNYNITKNFNKCMDCHAADKAPQYKATKVGESHYKDRDGKVSQNISPRRYFCMQCHVPQTDAKPLVANTFKGAPASAK